MPSAFSARDNAALTATCCACQKTTPTELMVSLTGNEDGGHKYYSVSLRAQAKVGVRQVSLEFMPYLWGLEVGNQCAWLSPRRGENVSASGRWPIKSG